jgi:hypothetical protein
VCPVIHLILFHKTASDDDGWSPVGILFFTLFWISVALFVALFIYNRYGRGIEGWQAVPGYRFARICHERFSESGPKYTPQEDQSSSLASTGGYGATGYQTEHL